jgi:hypothetical protein
MFRLHAAGGVPYFFYKAYQPKPEHVPTGLMMNTGRMVLKQGWGTIINPAGHFASGADSS